MRLEVHKAKNMKKIETEIETRITTYYKPISILHIMEPMNISPQKKEPIDPNHPLLKEKYTEGDHQTLDLIIGALKRSTKCEMCGGEGHTPATCGTKTMIDNAVKTIPGVRKLWWDMKASKKHSLQ